jgi:hypothetical protein
MLLVFMNVCLLSYGTFSCDCGLFVSCCICLCVELVSMANDY